MNKKILAAALGLAMSSGFALAADDLNFYIGADAGYHKFNISNNVVGTGANLKLFYKDKTPSGTVVVGVKAHENFGAEVGYTFYNKLKAKSGYTGNIKLNSFHADLLGYMPVDQNFDVVGALGVGRIHIHDKLTAPVIDKKLNEGVIRAGLGGQYKFDDHFAARAMVRYQYSGSKKEVALASHVLSFNLGVTYTI